MIIGIGTDLIQISRIEKACAKERFLKKIYTEKECRLAKKRSSFLAGNFAVKEAVSKSLGTGFLGFMPRDIEVLRDELGKPYVNLYHGALRRAKQIGAERILVSISNTNEYAMAFALAEGE